MLVLMREIGDSFSIGNDITVQVLAVSGNQVRLGISAPREVRVHRAEVYRRIQARLEQEAGERVLPS